MKEIEPVNTYCAFPGSYPYVKRHCFAESTT